ncbi:hypothetical protein GGR51DRAFT_574412 [Nemania sp. FL0031]|nr:hypothetical protein GGR51DRAFT_574412 [Nemania sp. FL0031]
MEDKHSDQETNRGTESSISSPGTPGAGQPGQQPQLDSPRDPVTSQPFSEHTDLPAHCAPSEVSESTTKLNRDKIPIRQFLLGRDRQRSRSLSSCSSTGVAASDIFDIPPSTQPPPLAPTQTPASSQPQAAIPSTTATASITSTAATPTAASTTTTGPTPTGVPLPTRPLSSAPFAPFVPTQSASFVPTSTPQQPTSFTHPGINAATPQAYFRTAPWFQHPARPPIAFPRYLVPNTYPRAYSSMAAPNTWSPLAQSLFCPPPQLQQPQQPQQQQYWYYYPGVTPATGLPMTCTRPSPFWSGTSHYLTNPPPQAPQVYTIEPAYIMPQTTYYQSPAAAPVYYYAAGAPIYYYPS